MNELFLRHFLESAIVLPAAGYALLPVWDHLRYSKKTVLGIMLLLALAYMVIQSLVSVWNYSVGEYLMLPALLIFYIVYHVVVDLSTGKKLYCFLNSCMLAEFCNLYTNILRAPVEQYDSNGPFLISSCLICLGLTLVIGAVFYHMLTHNLPELLVEDRLDFIWLFLSVIPALMTVLMHWATPADPSVVMFGRIQQVALALLILIPAVTLLLHYLFWWITMQLVRSAQLEQENELLQMEQKRHMQLRSYMDSTRALRHDFRQHLLVLRELSQKGETEKLSRYLGELTSDIDVQPTRLSANPSVDAVASWYDAEARKQNARIQWDLKLPQELPVSESDYCGILGNLLENALRATSKEPPGNRKIRVISQMLSGKMLGLSVDNSFSGKVRFDKKGLPVTFRRGHGVGLASVSATVHHYKGSMDISCENGTFSVNILLYSK
ncbi:MAG: GHKL domain-containing protein [Firmicutes bacterium]|nr:GHKL domain-containing protein [Bacillota bacterium]